MHQQEENAGKNKNIVDKPVTVNVFLRSCPNLSITDLPGKVVNRLADQPPDIAEQSEKLIKDYCSGNTETLLLCVTKANDDLANCQGYKITSEIDPYGERSMGVLTKTDTV